MCVNKKLILFLIFMLQFTLMVLAQPLNKKELEKKRRQKEEEIALTKKIINDTKSKQKKTLSQLRTINKQIKTREELINTVSSELNLLSEQVEQITTDISNIQLDLKRMKEEYARMIFKTYKTRNAYSRLMFIFSAKSFNQAAKRFKYLQQFAAHRRKQVDLINETVKKLEEKREELKQRQEEKYILVSKKEVEKSELKNDQEEETIVLNSLKNKEKQLRKELKEKQAAVKKLNRAIAELIAEEIRKEKERAMKEANAKNTGSKTDAAGAAKKEMTLTPEAIKLSADFTSNRHNLPWPVEKGFVSVGFGEHPHPTLKGVKTVNNGVDISTTEGAKARAMFKGEVRAVFSVPGMQNAVMISHGEYFTVYCNLDEVLLKRGDKVETKQAIGTVYTDQGESKTELHIEIWKGMIKLDPELWLTGN
jgi:septal ring factor EnvC (AmiA/AmiB activator)